MGRGSIDSESDLGIGARISSGWNEFLKFLYNPADKTVFGRGGKSWGQILIFYMFYYAFLTGLFALAITIVLSTLSPYVPTFQTRVQAPGVAIQPRLPSNKALTTDIKFNFNHNSSYNTYVEQMKKFLDGYKKNKNNSDLYDDCKNGPVLVSQDFTPGELSRVCKFNVDVLKDCAIYPYGYDTGKPCILVKVNRIINWFPVLFNDLSEAVGNKDSKAPALVDVLKAYNRQYDPYLMYVACYGVDAEDATNLNGVPGISTNTKYFPDGIPFMYYPYRGNQRSPHYESPLVAVQFTNVTRNQEIRVRCKVYSRNIIDDDRMQIGYMEFKLKIDG